MEEGKTYVTAGNNFSWSFKPITGLMTLFGFRLDMLNHTNRVVNFIILSFGLLLLVVNLINVYFQGSVYEWNISFFVLIYVLAINRIDNEIGNKVARVFLKEALATMMQVSLFFVVPAIFTIHRLFAIGRWKQLWLTLWKIHEEMDLPLLIYPKCRKISFFAIGLLFLVLVEPSE